MVNLRFHGGSDEVTGSRHLLDYGSGRVLLDCGLFQGHRRESIDKNKTFPAPPDSIEAVLLSHAHIDHCGGLPLLVKNGFKRPIHCTKPTVDLLHIMLMDSAFLQEEDAKFFNKIHQADGQIIEPLYTQDDAKEALKLVVPHEYEVPFQVGGIQAEFLNAGHVLGSAMIKVQVDAPKGKRHILFTGDLGRQKTMLMKPPEIPSSIDYLLIESTYGGRLHEPIGQVDQLFAEIINETVREKGKLLIPSFALERTQEVVFILEKLRRGNKIPPIHMYVDSPMAVEITDVFNKNLDSASLSQDFKNSLSVDNDPFGLKSIRYVRTVDESKSLNDLPGEKIILAGSGMCEGGRILHHLRNNIEDEKTTILLVGYQSQGTLGRRLSEGAPKVKIFGLEHRVAAKVKMLHNFSSHADQNDLLFFIKGFDPRPQNIFLVHGDPDQKQKLVEVLASQGITRVSQPRFGETFDLE